MSSKARLVYFNGRGLAESVRFMLAATGIEFEETFLTEKDQMEKLRKDGDLLFMQVPMLEIDGKKIVQRSAIVRYLAREHGLDGKMQEEKTRADVLYEGAMQFCYAFLGFDDDVILKTLTSSTLKRYLPIFEQILNESTSGYLVGDGLTYPDLSLLEALLNSEEWVPGSLQDYPKLKDFKDRISSLPQMKAFLEGPQKKPRNDAVYCSSVKRALGWD